MKEIKFRAWNHDTNQMSEPFTLMDNLEWYQNETPCYDLMQFTGLKDKNGVEIYDGDLLREEADGEWEQDNYMVQEVFFHDGNEADQHIGWQMNRIHFQGSLSGSSVWNKMLPKYTEKMYVIGNIYKNPELLKRKEV